MKAIITVVGKDKGGIVAGVATKIACLLYTSKLQQELLLNFQTQRLSLSAEFQKK